MAWILVESVVEDKIRVYEYNGRYVGVGKGSTRQVWWSSKNELWKNIGCLILTPTSSIGG